VQSVTIERVLAAEAVDDLGPSLLGGGVPLVVGELEVQ
jgi:hypothetical protein